MDLLQADLTFSSCLENKTSFQMNNMMFCITCTCCDINHQRALGYYQHSFVANKELLFFFGIYHKNWQL